MKASNKNKRRSVEYDDYRKKYDFKTETNVSFKNSDKQNKIIELINKAFKQ